MKELLKLLETGDFRALKEKLTEEQTYDIAQLINEVPLEQGLVIFRLLSKDKGAEVFSHLKKKKRKEIIATISEGEFQSILDSLFMDDTIDLLEELPANVVGKILGKTSEDKREIINTFLNYPEDTAGSIMTIEYVDLKEDMTVADALARVRKKGIDRDTVNNCFVLGENRKLQGCISLRKLILSNPDDRVADLIGKYCEEVETLEDQEQVIQRFKNYDLITMPVVDGEKRLVGVITVDDVIDVIEIENTEDFQKMAAMEPSEEEYLNTGVISLAKHRIIWLLVLMISATVTAYIMRGYEDVLESVVLLAVYIPMLMDTGGNAGAQSSTLVIRALALGNLRLADIGRVIWKEFRVSMIVGFTLAFVNFLRIYFLEGVGVEISLAVCISLFATVIVAKIVGGCLPIIAKKLKLDPAIMASPLITTIVDAVALLIYFSIASLLIGL